MIVIFNFFSTCLRTHQPFCSLTHLITFYFSLLGCCSYLLLHVRLSPFNLPQIFRLVSYLPITFKFSLNTGLVIVSILFYALSVFLKNVFVFCLPDGFYVVSNIQCFSSFLLDLYH